jgi:hypothetical protein
MIMTSFSVLRISLVASMPVIPGIIMSMRIKSNGGSSCTFLMASEPFGWNMSAMRSTLLALNLPHQQQDTLACWRFSRQSRSKQRHHPRPGHEAV